MNFGLLGRHWGELGVNFWGDFGCLLSGFLGDSGAIFGRIFGWNFGVNLGVDFRDFWHLRGGLI